MHLADAASVAARPAGIWRYLELLPVDAPPARGLAVGGTALVRGRSPRPGPRRPHGLAQGRQPQPDALLQGPRRGHGRRPGGRVRLRHAGLRLDRQPGRRHGGRGGRGRAAQRRLHPGRPGAGQDRPCAGLRRDGRAGARARTTRSTACRWRWPARCRGPSSTSTCGPTTPRAARRSPSRSPSSWAGGCPMCIVAPLASGSLYVKTGKAVHELDGGRPGRVAIRCASSAVSRTAARPSPVPSARARSVIEPVRQPDTIVKSLAIGDPADGSYALELARASGGSLESVPDMRHGGGHPPRGRDRGHLHRDGRRGDGGRPAAGHRPRRRPAPTTRWSCC